MSELSACCSLTKYLTDLLALIRRDAGQRMSPTDFGSSYTVHIITGNIMS